MGLIAKRTYSETDVVSGKITLGYKAQQLSIANLHTANDLIIEIPQFNNTTTYYAKIPPSMALNAIPLTEFNEINIIQNSTSFAINILVEQQLQVRIQ